jgi:hypothetical protein
MQFCVCVSVFVCVSLCVSVSGCAPCLPPPHTHTPPPPLRPNQNPNRNPNPKKQQENDLWIISKPNPYEWAFGDTVTYELESGSTPIDPAGVTWRIVNGACESVYVFLIYVYLYIYVCVWFVGGCLWVGGYGCGRVGGNRPTDQPTNQPTTHSSIYTHTLQT